MIIANILSPAVLCKEQRRRISAAGGDGDNGGEPSFDPDAAAGFFLITESGGAPLSGTQQNAVNALIVAMKGTALAANPDASLWSAMVACYLFVGDDGTGIADSVDWTGNNGFVGWQNNITHSNSTDGIKGNSISNAYGNTGVNPSQIGGSPFGGLTINIPTFSGGIGSRCLFGAVSSTNTYGIFAASTMTAQFHGTPTITKTGTKLTGAYTINRDSLSSLVFYYNGGVVSNNTTNVTGVPANPNLYLLAENLNGTATKWSGDNLSFAALHKSLGATDVTNLHALIATFNAALGRS